MTRDAIRNSARGAVAAALATRTTRTRGRRHTPILEAGADPAAKAAVTSRRAGP